MSLFICESCFCVENTALGLWWTRGFAPLWGGAGGRALCSACAPSTYSDGTPTKYGTWHGSFPRNRATEADREWVLNPEVLDLALSADVDGDGNRSDP